MDSVVITMKNGGLQRHRVSTGKVCYDKNYPVLLPCVCCIYQHRSIIENNRDLYKVKRVKIAKGGNPEAKGLFQIILLLLLHIYFTAKLSSKDNLRPWFRAKRVED